MDRYRVRLLQDRYIWSIGEEAKNQIITLFKPEQTFKTDLSFMFSNYDELDSEAKIYASTFADDLFSSKEILELMNLLGVMEGVQLSISNRISLPFLYDHSVGISVIPTDRRTRHISFSNTEELSFPLQGFVRWGRNLVDPSDIQSILQKENLSEKQLKELLLKL